MGFFRLMLLCFDIMCFGFNYLCLEILVLMRRLKTSTY